MPRSLAPVAGVVLCLSLAPAALANDEPPATATPSTEAAAATADTTIEDTDAADSALPSETMARSAVEEVAELDNDPIRCRRVQVTGTRVKKGKVCKPESEWRRMQEDARAMMKDVARKASPQPGGQNLPQRNSSTRDPI